MVFRMQKTFLNHQLITLFQNKFWECTQFFILFLGSSTGREKGEIWTNSNFSSHGQKKNQNSILLQQIFLHKTNGLLFVQKKFLNH